MGPRIAVLMTCHNRKQKTLRALATLRRQRGLPPEAVLTVHLVDAGSRDGTAEAVACHHPDVDVVAARDDVFWGEGMRIASRRCGPFDYQLWLNDDVSLDEDALAMLLETSRSLGDVAVVAGATRSSDGTRITYSGLRRAAGPAWTPRHMWTPLLEPSGVAQPMDTCHGNVVLVPEAVHRTVGDIDAAFPHNMGDWDFALRARRAGFGVYLAPRPAGMCDANPPQGSSRELGIGVGEALRRVSSTRELPFGSWRVYCARHLWPWAPVSLLSPYVKAGIRAMMRA
jgi:GT2 family glycosyltransferase